MKSLLGQADVLNRWNLTPALSYAPVSSGSASVCCVPLSLSTRERNPSEANWGIPHTKQPASHPASNSPISPDALQAIIPSLPFLHWQTSQKLTSQPIVVWLFLLETILKTTTGKRSPVLSWFLCRKHLLSIGFYLSGIFDLLFCSIPWPCYTYPDPSDHSLWVSFVSWSSSSNLK